MTHYDADDVIPALTAADIAGTWPRRHTVTLAEGDSCWNPGSTKTVIYGPAVVTFTEWADGGISAHLEER